MMNPRRIKPTLGTAVAAAFAAALIGAAPAARADGPDPFEDLFGDSGINIWTPSADSFLDSNDPTLAGSLDGSVDNFLDKVDGVTGGINEDWDPLSNLVYEFDPTSFQLDGYYTSPGDGGLPITGLSDLAVGLDYTLFAADLEPVGTGLTDLVQIPFDISIALLYLPLLPLILAGA